MKGHWSTLRQFLLTIFDRKRKNDALFAKWRIARDLSHGIISAICIEFLVKIALFSNWMCRFLRVKNNNNCCFWPVLIYKDKAFTWCTILQENVYSRIFIGLSSWPLFHLNQKDSKDVNSVGYYVALNRTTLHKIYIFENTKGPFINIRIANGEFTTLSHTKFAKLHNFSFFSSGLPWHVLDLLNFQKKQSMIELLVFIFENSSPKGSFR